jgi:hypothetical protein
LQRFVKMRGKRKDVKTWKVIVESWQWQKWGLRSYKEEKEEEHKR